MGKGQEQITLNTPEDLVEHLKGGGRLALPECMHLYFNSCFYKKGLNTPATKIIYATYSLYIILLNNNLPPKDKSRIVRYIKQGAILTGITSYNKSLWGHLQTVNFFNAKELNELLETAIKTIKQKTEFVTNYRKFLQQEQNKNPNFNIEFHKLLETAIKTIEQKLESDTNYQELLQQEQNKNPNTNISKAGATPTNNKEHVQQV